LQLTFFSIHVKLYLLYYYLLLNYL